MKYIPSCSSFCYLCPSFTPPLQKICREKEKKKKKRPREDQDSIIQLCQITMVNELNYQLPRKQLSSAPFFRAQYKCCMIL